VGSTALITVGGDMRRRRFRAASFLCGLVLGVLGGAGGPAWAQSPDVTLLGRGGDLAEAPRGRSISADGRFVVFASAAPDLVAGQADMNGGERDVFLADRVTGTVTLVSHVPGAPATTGNGDSYAPLISADGAFVVFFSDATDLVGAPGSDLNDDIDLFLFERATGTVTLVSHVPGLPTTTGDDGVEDENGLAISADGAYVAFVSHATDLAGVNVNGTLTDVFLFDRLNGATVTLVSHALGSPTTTGNSSSLSPTISADGAYVAFESNANDLIASDPNQSRDVFLYERATGSVILVSHVPGLPLTPGDNSSLDAEISANGAYVVFSSGASDLVGSDPNGFFDVFLYERTTGTVTLVSHLPGLPTAAGNNLSDLGVISADGAFVAFRSSASDLAGPDPNGTQGDVFLYERATGVLTLVSHAAGLPTTAGNGASRDAKISADGAIVAFSSTASDLVSGGVDANGGSDVFVYERATGAVTLVSHVPGQSATTGNGGSIFPGLSADGRVVVFPSTATDLVAGDSNGPAVDVFAFDRGAAAGVAPVTLSQGVGGVPADGASEAPRVSADGRYVVFASGATNLVAGGSPPGVPQVYRVDRQTGEVRRVSETAGGQAGDGPSAEPVVSGDGRYVAYRTGAGNLVADCGPAGVDRIVRTDLATGQTVCVSQGAAGAATGASRQPAMSEDGTRIAFVTAAALDAVCANGQEQIHLRDVAAATTRCLSVDANGQAGTGPSGEPALSGDGTVVVYTTQATNLVLPAGSLAAAAPSGGRAATPARQAEALSQVMRRSTAVGATVTELMSRGPAGALGNGASRQPAVSRDGQTVAFSSTATNVVAECGNGAAQVLVATGGGMQCASRDETGAPGDGGSVEPAVSGDGQIVVWVSLARNLTRGLTGPPDVSQLLRRSLVQNAVVELLSQAGGAAGNGASRRPALDFSGAVTVFQTAASNLASGDTNGQSDILLVAIPIAAPGTPDRVTITAPANGTALPLTGPTPLTITWTARAGATQYGLEFTGPDRVFANPNGTGPDAINGFGGAGGAVVVEGTRVDVLLDSGVPPGLYQVRVVGLTAAFAVVGRFSDAVTVALGAVPPGNGRVAITAPGTGALLVPGTPVTFVWGALPNVASYFFEFTGPGGAFTNPNGTGPDPANQAGGGVVIPATGFTTTVPPLPPGVYQVRVIGRTASGAFVGTFSDALAVTIQ
jgi:Tol biopolymer transport system component